MGRMQLGCRVAIGLSRRVGPAKVDLRDDHRLISVVEKHRCVGGMIRFIRCTHCPERELLPTDRELVSHVQRRRTDQLLAVDERAVARAEIFQRDRGCSTVGQSDHRMLSTHCRLRDHHITRGMSTENRPLLRQRILLSVARIAFKLQVVCVHRKLSVGDGGLRDLCGDALR